MKYCGIDLHSNNSVVVITDETDHVLHSKRHPNDLTQILRALEIHRAELSGVVVESTYNWYWLVDGLLEAGYRVHLANTTAIKQYDGLKHRGDESDARHLAHVLRLGLLPEGHIMPKAERAVRDLARKRMQLVQQRTAQILSIENSLSRYTGGHISSNSIKRLQETDLTQMQLGDMRTLGLKANVAVMQALQEQIDGLEKMLAQHCRKEAGYRLLKTVDGIGEVLATVIMLETGDIARFNEVGNYASYCRCVASRHESNGKKKAKRNSTVAIKAVAHKLARACYHILKNKETFSVERCFA